ncbi:MAG: DUF1801 domain-containing protein [Planctomycetota bacterium]
MPGQPAADVAAFLATCRHPLRAELDALRAIVAKADPRLVEAIKWNAPSWGLPDAADHCMTINLGNKATLRLVLHRGAQKGAEADAAPFVDFDATWLHWPAADRAVATFASMAELDAARPALVQLLKLWTAALRAAAAPPVAKASPPRTATPADPAAPAPRRKR